MFFKVFSADHELTQVLYEASVISALRLQGVGVAGIVLTRKGANAIRVEAEGAVRWGVLYEDAGVTYLVHVHRSSSASVTP